MKYFLFDIGNVLVNFDFNELYAIHSTHSGLPVVPFSTADFELRDAVERGEVSDAEWVAYLNRSRGLSWGEIDLIDAWANVFSVNTVGRALFERAQAASGVSVYTLSNIAQHHIDAIEQNWPRFFDGADGLFLSHQIGARKPHSGIYHHALEQLGVDGEQCFFVDDMPENVAAAQSFGIHAHLFVPENIPALLDAVAQFFGWKEGLLD